MNKKAHYYTLKSNNLLFYEYLIYNSSLSDQIKLNNNQVINF